MTEPSEGYLVTIASAAFHLEEELAGRPDRGEVLQEIAGGRLTLIGSNLPEILELAGGRLEPWAANSAVAMEREAARLLLLGLEDAERRMQEPEG